MDHNTLKNMGSRKEGCLVFVVSGLDFVVPGFDFVALGLEFVASGLDFVAEEATA